MRRTILVAVLVLCLPAVLAAPLAAQASSASPTPELTAGATGAPDSSATTDGGGSSFTATWGIVAIVAISGAAIVVWLERRRNRE